MRAFEDYFHTIPDARSAVVVIVIDQDGEEMRQLLGAYYDIEAPDEDLPIYVIARDGNVIGLLDLGRLRGDLRAELGGARVMGHMLPFGDVTQLPPPLRYTCSAAPEAHPIVLVARRGPDPMCTECGSLCRLAESTDDRR
jgi:hypothetical protein